MVSYLDKTEAEVDFNHSKLTKIKKINLIMTVYLI